MPNTALRVSRFDVCSKFSSKNFASGTLGTTIANSLDPQHPGFEDRSYVELHFTEAACWDESFTH
jgi:hypothetical protein